MRWPNYITKLNSYVDLFSKPIYESMFNDSCKSETYGIRSQWKPTLFLRYRQGVSLSFSDQASVETNDHKATKGHFPVCTQEGRI